MEKENLQSRRLSMSHENNLFLFNTLVDLCDFLRHHRKSFLSITDLIDHTSFCYDTYFMSACLRYCIFQSINEIRINSGS